MTPAYESSSVTLYLGDMREVLASMPENSVDSVVCDPPYELNFMGKSWDSTGVAFQAATWVEVKRVLKPGGTVLDPFLGSGTTVLAAQALGFKSIGVELLAEHLDIVRARLGLPPETRATPVPASAPAKATKPQQLTLLWAA